MEDFEGNQRYAEYKKFKVDDEKVKTKNPFSFIVKRQESLVEIKLLWKTFLENNLYSLDWIQLIDLMQLYILL